MKVLQVEKITKSFGDFTAVDNITFSIDEGVIFGFIGPNGAGKTTTIRMIMNIIIPDSGKVAILGDENARTASDMIGYLPEERGMYRKMKVKDLLLFLGELKSKPKSFIKKEIDYWLERMELSEWKNKKIEELSKGMQQKIQFAGTVLHKPKLLILDEPFGGLDPINQLLIKDLLLELKEKGTTIIFSTHVMETAEKLCEELILINKGKQVLYGSLSKIKQDFGRKHVLIEYDGKDDFLKDLKDIEKYDNYGNMVEISLGPQGNAQNVLKAAMQNAVIKKFEIKEPSLNEIFVESVGSSEQGGEI
ncbi:ABC transporter [candidate division KSB1 bacterium]|nr:MAG: ABC transporter [candidate division KSB1 bacterium]